MVDTLNNFQGKKVGLDTAPLIYLIEQNSNFYLKIVPYFQANARGEFIFVTSFLTWLEVLVQPFRLGKSSIANQYHQILTSSQGLHIYPFDESISLIAADLRARYNIRTPDAIQLATCIQQQCPYFLTNDQNLKKVKEIDVVLVDELN